MAEDKHVTLTLEEADQLVEVLEHLRPGSHSPARITITRVRLAELIRQRWLDALRKESA